METKSRQDGTMLEHFSLSGALGHFLCTFWALLAHLGRFFRFFGRSGLDFAGSGAGFGAFKPNFSIFFGVSQHKSQKCSSCNKTTIFAMFYRLWNMSHTATARVFCIAFRAWLDMVHGLLQKIPAGIHFLLFATTLQRGGTCEAH